MEIEAREVHGGNWGADDQLLDGKAEETPERVAPIKWSRKSRTLQINRITMVQKISCDLFPVLNAREGSFKVF